MSSGTINPSVKRNPTASSKSPPGVLIVTATDRWSWPGPCTRISSGSSAAKVSVRSDRTPSFSATTCTFDVFRRSGWAAVAITANDGTSSVRHGGGRDLRDELPLPEPVQCERRDEVGHDVVVDQVGHRDAHDRRGVEPVGAPSSVDQEPLDVGE